MNYLKHYKVLIKRAKTRTIDEQNIYYERHHIKPRCLGGKDISSNLVHLTAEEHFVAHQLLVKIYPGNHKLIFALNAMSMSRPGQEERLNNKQYGWIKRRVAESKSQYQKNNIYMNNGISNTRISKEQEEEYHARGWQRGFTERTFKRDESYVNKDGSYIRIPTGRVDEYIELGWSLGRGKGTGNNKSKIYITRNGVNKRINPVDFDLWRDSGWKMGLTINNPCTERKPYEIKIRKHRWINKGNQRMRVSASELQDYINEGWEAGSNVNNKGRGSGTKYMNKDGICKRIPIEDTKRYYMDGWSYGRA